MEMNKKTAKELKKETKEVDKRITKLQAEKKAVENKGCFSDQELNEREKKIKSLNNQIRFLGEEKKHIAQSLVDINNKSWLKRKG